MPKKYNLKYVTSSGVTVDFNGRPYTWERPSEILDYDWEITSRYRSSRHGADITRFNRGVVERELLITVYAGDGSSIDQHVAYLSGVFESDILLNRPGKIFVNDSFVYGFVKGSRKTIYKTNRIAKIELTLAISSPFWITEELHTFEPLSTGSTDGFIFPLGFPYGFVSPDVRTLINDHYGPCMAKISFYGPCTDPEINLGPNTYKVFGELLPGERFEIDQVAMTVTKITAGGERLNFLYARHKAKSVFDRIPAGESFVTATDFTFDILLYKERSEPKWS